MSFRTDDIFNKFEETALSVCGVKSTIVSDS